MGEHAKQVYPRAISAPGWAKYLVGWAHGVTWCATEADVARVARASGRTDHHVVRIVDAALVWPTYNPRLPRGRA